LISNDRDSLLTLEDVLDWEIKNGEIPNGSVVIMNSGNGPNYGDKALYLGFPSDMDFSNPDVVNHMHFPGFDSEAVEWLAENRQLCFE